MLVVDSQIHIWGTGLPTNPAHRQITSFSADDVLKEMDGAGVDAAVIHPPGWDPNSNPLAIEAARQHPSRFAILGNFPLDRAESRALVDGWKQQPGMLGLRFSFNQPGRCRRLGQQMAPWIGCGRPSSAPVCRSGWPRLLSSRWSGRSRNDIQEYG